MGTGVIMVEMVVTGIAKGAEEPDILEIALLVTIHPMTEKREEGDPTPLGLSHSGLINYRAPEGNPRTKIVMGSAEGRTHAKALDQVLKKDPEAKNAVFRRATTPEHAAARKESLRGAPRAGELPGSGPAPAADREEKFPPASQKPKNEVAKSMTAAVTYARRDEARHVDGPLMKAAKKQPGENRDYVYASSMRPEDDGPDNGMNLKTSRGGRTELARSKAEKLRAAKRGSESSSGRSNSPEEDDRPRRTHRVRDEEKDSRRRRRDDDDRRRRDKRDAVGLAGHKQAEVESDHPDTTGDFKQQYQAYMEAFNIVRSNATDIVMPIVKDLNDGSNAEVVWGMGWELLSLAEPSIVVGGGLFRNGMHACDWYEDLMANDTSLTEDDMTGLRAVNAVLIDLYQDSYQEAVDVLEAAGVDVQLAELGLLLDTNDTSVANLNDDHSNTEYIIDFFAQLPNSTLIGLPDDDNSTSSAGVNSTALTGLDGSLPSATAVSLPVGKPSGEASGEASGIATEPKQVPGTDSEKPIEGVMPSATATTLKGLRAIMRATATPTAG
ncbi:MAG: hypothetical protein Q9218_004460 [Villophora microphyllina]